jgi:membrane-associated protein
MTTAQSLFGVNLGDFSAGAAYAIVFVFVLVESGVPAGLLLPGDSLLFGAGLLAAAPGSSLSIPLLVALTCVAGVLGDAAGYELGRRAGRPWLLRRQGRLNASHVARAEVFTARYGWLALVAARFIPWVRSFVPMLAGIGRMRYAVFTVANLIGALAWGTSITLLGYYAYHVPWLRNVATVLTVIVLSAALVMTTAQLVRSRRQRPDGSTPTPAPATDDADPEPEPERQPEDAAPRRDGA